ncbi:tagaturonate epimerase family protein [Oceanobacillus sp. ISL-73]|uniref:tagaturonate epimerase family protein n=1 Tax=Oceanobacillus sp. ISL-73 TaxID=2819161 RepID=UPI001BEB0F3A|nr:tagaturonate epimerase family protein [Oceanobacillus sp. ISL-73]
METLLSNLKLGEIGEGTENIKIYKRSLTHYQGTFLLMIKESANKFLLASGEGPLYSELNGQEIGDEGKVCPLTHHNRLVLNRYFDYTVPSAFGKNTATIGLGDRLGIASPGHIEAIKNRDVKPILGQQSIRELTLTKRTMEDMIDTATFAVFQEGYKDGFGIDADHIKKEEDIKRSLELGVTMLTLDCSDYIQKDVESASKKQVQDEFAKLDVKLKKYYLNTYSNQVFSLKTRKIAVNEIDVMRNVLIYGKAVAYMIHVFNTYVRHLDRDFDFEISIDETEAITSPEAHFFVANELRKSQVEVTSLAPRFCGEFQKGIDYIGDIDQFEKELSDHVDIAKHFGYKLSIHSGSDKFSVFPIISKHTERILHIKTAGTSWLEALRVIANKNPSLYRKIHAYAEKNVEQALKYYHITPNFEAITPLEDTKDSMLSEYLNDDNARQLLHITYGLILTANRNESSLFKDEIYSMLSENEDVYREYLIKHIGKHVETLGL